MELYLGLGEEDRARVCEGLEYVNELGESEGCGMDVLAEIVEGLVRLH